MIWRKRGAGGQAIPLLSGLLSIVDRCNAMADNRAYHLAWSPRQGLALLAGEHGSKHDPEVVGLTLAREEEWLAEH